MADFKPLKLHENEVQRFAGGDTVPVAHGGTGSATATGARTQLGLVIGDDVQEHSALLDALGGWSSTGLLVGTGTGFVPRDLATASAQRITITNGDGVAGNPTFDLATTGVTPGTGFYKFQVDAYGRVISTTAVAGSDITALVDSNYVAKGGDTLTGYLTLHADPSSALHAATKQYVDNLFDSGGTAPFDSVRVKTVGDITLSGLQTIDGVSLSDSDRVLVASQTNGLQNGIYVAAAGAWTRAADADSSGEFNPGRLAFVTSGTQFGNTGWVVGNATQPTLGSDVITFVQTSGSTQYTNGNGLNLVGTQFSVNGVAGQIAVSGGGVGLASGIVAPGTYTKITVDTYGRATTGASATASDVGAQPSSATLTALASYDTNGIITQTATGTFAGRTLSTASAQRITITNGNGVAGDPTFDLATTAVSPGTYNSVTVDAYGRVTGGTAQQTDVLTETVTNGSGGSIVIGQVVYVSGDNTVSLALANNITTSKAVGLVFSTSIGNSASGMIATSGTVEATTGQWDSVTGGSGGLTTGAEYFISNATAGRITTSAPSTGVLAPIGIAISPTKLKIGMRRVVIL